MSIHVPPNKDNPVALNGSWEGERIELHKNYWYTDLEPKLQRIELVGRGDSKVIYHAPPEAYQRVTVRWEGRNLYFAVLKGTDVSDIQYLVKKRLGA